MAVNVAVKSIFDDRGIKNAEKAFAGAGAGIGGSLKKLAGIVAAAFSVKAVVDFGKQAILAAEQVQQANNRIENIAQSMDLFGAQTGAVSERLIEFAEAKELQFGVDAELIKAGQAQLLTFKNLAASADETGGMFDRATVASADLAAAGFGSIDSASIMLGKALNDPIKGITALNRAGVQFSEDQKAMIKSLVETGDVAAAQELILAEVERQVGGTAEATALASEKMRLGFENLTEQVGMLLLPTFEKFVDFMTAEVFPVVDDFLATFEKDMPEPQPLGLKIVPELEAEGDKSPGEFLVGFFQDMIGKAQEWLASGGLTELTEGAIAMRQAFIDALPALIGGATDLILALANALIGMVPLLIEGAIQLFMSLVEALIVVVPLLIQELGLAIPELITQLVGLLPLLIEGAIQLFLGLVDALVTVIPIVIIALLEALPGIVTALVGALPLIIDGAIQLFLGLAMGLIEAIPALLDTLVNDVLPQLLTTLVTLIPQLLIGAIEFFLALATAVPKILPELIPAIIGLIPEITGALIEAIPQLVDAGFKLLEGLISGLITEAPRLIGDAMANIGNWIMQGFEDIMQIESPSKVFIGYGGDIVDGLVQGIDDDLIKVQATAENLAMGMDAEFISKSVLMQDDMQLAGIDFGADPGAAAFNITINAGVGSDPVAIGRYVTDAIKRYETVSGRVFARA